MELLRELCGDKLILGCGVPLMPAFGLVDYCRVSCDVSLDWDNSWIMRQTHRERVSTRQAIGSSILRRQLNGRAFISDPDVFFLRENNVKLSGKEKRKLALICSLFGGVLLCSDNMAEYSAEAKALYGQMLENRNAECVRVENDGELVVRYRVKGEDREIVIG
jgi:alpha-galactosidase